MYPVAFKVYDASHFREEKIKYPDRWFGTHHWKQMHGFYMWQVMKICLYLVLLYPSLTWAEPEVLLISERTLRLRLQNKLLYAISQGTEQNMNVFCTFQCQDDSCNIPKYVSSECSVTWKFLCIPRWSLDFISGVFQRQQI